MNNNSIDGPCYEKYCVCEWKPDVKLFGTARYKNALYKCTPFTINNARQKMRGFICPILSSLLYSDILYGSHTDSPQSGHISCV